jgi:hypothetical protein
MHIGDRHVEIKYILRTEIKNQHTILCLLMRGTPEHGLKNGSKTHEFVETGRFAKIPSRTESSGIRPVLRGIGRTQHQNW